MMFLWEPDMIRFMRDASEYGNYHEKLAELIGANITKNDHICDAGCGLGYLSLALSKYAGEVTSVDINRDALQVLKSNCLKNNVDNISIHCTDMAAFSADKKFDSMAFCFFGNIDEVLSIAKRNCRGKVFVMHRNYVTHRFSVDSMRTERDSADNMRSYLEGLNIPFEKRDLDLELGQPFKSFQDARRFFEMYNRDENKSVLTDEFIESKLVATGREDFPLYMPHERQVGWLMFEASDIPESCINKA